MLIDSPLSDYSLPKEQKSQYQVASVPLWALEWNFAYDKLKFGVLTSDTEGWESG